MVYGVWRGLRDSTFRVPMFDVQQDHSATEPNDLCESISSGSQRHPYCLDGPNCASADLGGPPGGCPSGLLNVESELVVVAVCTIH